MNESISMRVPTPSWVAPLAGLIAFLLVAVVGGLVTADWIIRNNEMRTLVSAIEASEAQMMATQEQVNDVFRPFDVGGALTPEETAVLTQKLAGIAIEAEVRIAQAGDQVAGVQILPWHGRIIEAQEAYLTHNQAWIDYMARAAQDPVEFVNPQPVVNESFLAAEPILASAVPVPALYQLQQRVAQIFIDGTPEEMTGSQISWSGRPVVVVRG